MKNNKFNLFLGCLLPIYIAVFITFVLLMAFSDNINEQIILILVPFHIFMMFISIYTIILHVVYFDQNKSLTGYQKGVWFVIHFASFSFSFPFFWWFHLSKWQTITLKGILLHFGLMKS